MWQETLVCKMSAGADDMQFKTNENRGKVSNIQIKPVDSESLLHLLTISPRMNLQYVLTCPACPAPHHMTLTTQSYAGLLRCKLHYGQWGWLLGKCA